MTLLYSASSSAVNPMTSRHSCAGENKDSAMKRILANIHQHAAVCKHFGVRNLRAVVKCDKGILHAHSSFKGVNSAKVIGKEKSGIAVTDNPVLVWWS